MLNLGIIGMSKGNGHPYSWAAIFNGYNRELMEACPFPAIPQYLSLQNFPEDGISEARVSHIWTQSKEISDHIAQSANIENVVTNMEDLTSEVDGILLARDDAENHLAMAEPFLKAGLPIYIDKPLAIARSDADSMYNLEQYEGQIFSCSALRFAQEFQLNKDDWNRIGDIQSIEAHVSGPWKTYGIHIIEPVLHLLGENIRVESVKSVHDGNSVKLTLESVGQIKVKFTANPDSSDPISIRIFGKLGEKEMIFNDSFNAFKSALQEFVEICNKKKENLSKDITLQCVELIERGL